MASTKRQRSISDEPESKKPKVTEATVPHYEPHNTKERVVLNPADCDLGQFIRLIWVRNTFYAIRIC